MYPHLPNTVAGSSDVSEVPELRGLKTRQDPRPTLAILQVPQPLVEYLRRLQLIHMQTVSERIRPVKSILAVIAACWPAVLGVGLAHDQALDDGAG